MKRAYKMWIYLQDADNERQDSPVDGDEVIELAFVLI